ncbi:unnamed protein product [Clonostachys chloroleuca]|uniref:Histone deacetylase complex subunit SAP30 Sin3 binding domain-containing protein n=1 Tax=Clonostachys chloroleuca TaxID=1926264 RepID=A0AA35M4K3_9HYPO|nr:unnamed protein product [Clonostachys chloroleuca]
MAPAKSSRNHDDSKSETPNAKEKNGSNHSSTKMRRVTSQQGGSSHQKTVNATAPVIPELPPTEPIAPSLQWSGFDRDALHAYRREHQLNTPSSFTSTFHQTIFVRPGSIGIYSPTMARRKKIRQNREQLAMAVRKHFNGLGIQENDVIVDLVYKVRSENASKLRGSANHSIITED